jgi:hypothetical protein
MGDGRGLRLNWSLICECSFAIKGSSLLFLLFLLLRSEKKQLQKGGLLRQK